MSTLTCPTCGERPVVVKGECRACYKRRARHAQPGFGKPRALTVRDGDWWATKLRIGDAWDCWEWTGARDTHGYGRVQIVTEDRKKKGWMAHRLMWEQRHGAVPEGLELDHLCRNPACVNPDHLEPVTHRENVLRGVSLCAQRAKQTHCKNGHPLTGENLMRSTTGKRECLICRRAQRRRWYAAKKATA